MKNLRNISSIAFGDGISKIAAFIATPYLAIKLQPVAFGNVGVVMAIYSFMSVFVQFGTNEYGILKVSPNRTIENIRTTLCGIISLRLMLLLISTVVLIFAILVFGFLSSHWLLLAAGFITLFVFSIAVDWVFISIEEMWITSFIRMLSRIIYVLLIFCLISKPEDAAIAIAIQGATELLVVFSLWLILFKRKAINIWIFSLKEIYPIFRGALPILLMTLSVSVFGSIDILLLGWLKSPEEVGYYSAALKLLLFGMSIRITLGPFIFPKIVKAWSISKDHSQEFLRNVQVYATSIAIAVGIIGCIYYVNITQLVLGYQYKNSGPVFAVVIWVAFFEIIGFVFAYFVFSIDQKLYTKIVITSAIANIVFNVILIKMIGILGSAIAYVISSAMIAVISFLYIRRQGIKPNIWKDISLPVIIGIISFSTTYIFLHSLSLIFSLVSGIGLFVVLLFSFKIIQWSNLKVQLGLS